MRKRTPLSERAKSNRRFKGESDADLKLLPTNFFQPELPPYTQMTEVEQEDLLTTEVEYHMLRGIRNEYRLKELTRTNDVRRIRRYIKKVHNRWSVTAGRQDMSAVRSRIIAKMNNVQEEAWRTVSSAKNNMERLAALRLIETSIKSEAEIVGLRSSDLVINNTTVNNQNLNQVSVKIAENKKTQDIASEFLELIGDNPV